MAEHEEMVEIQDPDDARRKKSIPRSEYDPAMHTLWSDRMAPAQADDPAHTPSMPVADVEPVPGPPMQDPTVAMSPEALPEQPNAAVIEAPGSKAAEIIQRQRGDEPIDMSGPREDRAEPETLRAQSVQRAMGGELPQTDEDRQVRREEMSHDQSKHEEDVAREEAAEKDEA